MICERVTLSQLTLSSFVTFLPVWLLLLLHTCIRSQLPFICAHVDMGCVVGASLRQSFCFSASSVGMHAARLGLANNWPLPFFRAPRAQPAAEPETLI